MLYHRRSKYTPDGDKTKFATLEEENKALRLKTAEQAIEIDMLKSKRLLCEPYPVVKWAKYFEVSTSGYSTWHERISERKAQEDCFDRLVREIFESGRGAYGAERICGIIRKRGFHVNYKKVKRSMNEQNLFSVHLRYQRCLTDSRKSRGEGFSNLRKNVVITEPFQALSSDITYIPTDEGFEYTCTKTGIILARKTADRIKKGLILATLSSIKKS